MKTAAASDPMARRKPPTNAKRVLPGVGKAICEGRLARGLSQVQAAVAAGVSPYRWLQAERDLASPGTVAAIAAFFGVDSAALLAPTALGPPRRTTAVRGYSTRGAR